MASVDACVQDEKSNKENTEDEIDPGYDIVNQAIDIVDQEQMYGPKMYRSHARPLISARAHWTAEKRFRERDKHRDMIRKKLIITAVDEGLPLHIARCLANRVGKQDRPWPVRCSFEKPKYELSPCENWVLEKFVVAGCMTRERRYAVVNVFTSEPIPEKNMSPWITLDPIGKPDPKKLADLKAAKHTIRDWDGPYRQIAKDLCRAREDPALGDRNDHSLASKQIVSKNSPGLEHQAGSNMDDSDSDAEEVPGYQSGCRSVHFETIALALPWKVARILFIGLMKEKPPAVLLSRMTVDLLARILDNLTQLRTVLRAIRYSNGWDPFGRRWIYVLPLVENPKNIDNKDSNLLCK